MHEMNSLVRINFLYELWILLILIIIIESYDKISTRQGCYLEISEMGKDIGVE